MSIRCIDRMKGGVIIASICIAVLSCRKNDENNIKSHPNGDLVIHNILKSKAVDSKILKFAVEFLDTLNQHRKTPLKTCRLFVEQKDASVRLKIGPIVYLSTIKNDLPSGYIEYQGIVILVYTGVEKLYEQQESIPNEISDLLKNKLTNDLLSDNKTIDPKFSPGLFSYPTWECAFENDSLALVNRHAKPVWRMQTKIFHAPDSLRSTPR